MPADAGQENGGCTISWNAEERVAVIFKIVFHVEVGDEEGLKCRERGSPFCKAMRTPVTVGKNNDSWTKEGQQSLVCTFVQFLRRNDFDRGRSKRHLHVQG